VNVAATGFSPGGPAPVVRYAVGFLVGGAAAEVDLGLLSLRAVGAAAISGTPFVQVAGPSSVGSGSGALRVWDGATLRACARATSLTGISSPLACSAPAVWDASPPTVGGFVAAGGAAVLLPGAALALCATGANDPHSGVAAAYVSFEDAASAAASGGLPVGGSLPLLGAARFAVPLLSGLPPAAASNSSDAACFFAPAEVVGALPAGTPLRALLTLVNGAGLASLPARSALFAFDGTPPRMPAPTFTLAWAPPTATAFGALTLTARWPAAADLESAALSPLSYRLLVRNASAAEGGGALLLEVPFPGGEGLRRVPGGGPPFFFTDPLPLGDLAPSAVFLTVCAANGAGLEACTASPAGATHVRTAPELGSGALTMASGTGSGLRGAPAALAAGSAASAALTDPSAVTLFWSYKLPGVGSL